MREELFTITLFGPSDVTSAAPTFPLLTGFRWPDERHHDTDEGLPAPPIPMSGTKCYSNNFMNSHPVRIHRVAYTIQRERTHSGGVRAPRLLWRELDRARVRATGR
ncbi:hypothetical protein AB5J62_12445 [Amycolatopsis sp. cg5]|uniref:hypothetical protein n=1 Tax=Amycolatopsis sp. cg5 TaxID=3238802 RepID=UPI003525E83C